MRVRRALSLSLVTTGAIALACAAQTLASKRTAQRERLEEFSAALARAGMSVPLPPRVCQEPPPSSSHVKRAPGGALVAFDDEIGCVAAAADVRPDDLVAAYARAIVLRRVPRASDERADALARAFLRGDPSLTAMAAAIEHEFDATRRARSHIGQSKPRRKKHGAPDVALDGGVLANDGETPARRRTVVDAELGGGVLDVLADGSSPSSMSARLVGTWATTEPEPIVDVHALCANGDWALHYEATDDIGRMAIADLEPVSGTWEVDDGEPPMITLTQHDGEEQQGTVTSLTEDGVDVAFEGDDNATKLVRRSKQAVCD